MLFRSIEAAIAALAAGAASVDVAVTHALFVEGALGSLHDAGVRHVWSTDTVPHATSGVSVAPTAASQSPTVRSPDLLRNPIASRH